MIHLEPPFTVTLALAAHRQAERLRQQHTASPKAKQVYLNALAVYAVSFYLECLEFQTDSSNFNDHWLMDSASLKVQTCGTLECRPVLPNETEIRIPPDVWSDRIGYVAVQLDESLRKASILGFVPTTTAERVALSELRSLTELLTHLRQLQQTASAPVNLGEWLRNVADASWQAIGEFFDPILNPAQPAFDFRGALSVYAGESNTPIIRRGKVLTLKTESSTIPVSLLVGLLPVSDQEIEIWVQVKAAEHPHLPPALKLLVLDEAGAEVMYAQARSTEAMQLQFTAEAGEQFEVQLVLDDCSITETFIVSRWV
ncbi:DUF1822 family protein [Oculatella sp. FACHB-28]|uniref:DUF1822 family protein n=1 Tax=Oculatella sp. FACHB-28 TaxID=2692845 RepID=UPI001687D9A8|nr:DUF1822 family protein [Oculatella sp. FACHB-28]MBD2055789.1 DUF1822 family protein [Oculatella sp. FACHB-28]